MPLLEVANLQAGYGDVQILHNVSLSVAEGEIVSLERAKRLCFVRFPECCRGEARYGSMAP
jgi:ABC-type histidine transport system ATPase subunit